MRHYTPFFPLNNVFFFVSQDTVDQQSCKPIAKICLCVLTHHKTMFEFPEKG